MFVRTIRGAASGVALSLLAVPAFAAVTVVSAGADVSHGAYTYDFAPGESLTFDLNTAGFASAYGVKTTGAVQVFSVFGKPSLFQPFATTDFPSQQLGAFASYANSTAVDFSQSEGTLGFEFALSDGEHFGLAKTDGTVIGSLFLQTTPGAGVNLGVPEPATWALLIMGFGGAGAALRRRRSPAIA